ncbi:MAG: threonylcarbamoyl-AMP synthase [Ruminococcus sp.]|nr:threonylcarbamoyl-AMP synthase [Ruminococcus sp.]
MYDTKMLAADADGIAEAAELLKAGEVVGMPTETVYGLAANALDPEAVKKIFIAKGRPQDNPLIVHICDIDMLGQLVKDIPEAAYRCAEAFWPGPLTMILPKRDIIPDVTSAGLATAGIRMPSNKTARALIKAAGFPLAAPSANLSGSPSPTTAQHVFKDMNGRIPCIIDDGSCAVGVESTVIAFERDGVRLLRPGFISVEDLRELFDNVIVDKGVTEEVAANAVVASPGMKYKHYAPKADITIIDGTQEQFREYCKAHSGGELMLMVFDRSDAEGLGIEYIEYGADGEAQARLLFDTLRRLDELGAKRVYARCPDRSGVGLAVYNRLLRAAGFQVIRL